MLLKDSDQKKDKYHGLLQTGFEDANMKLRGSSRKTLILVNQDIDFKEQITF